jgi:hypothetical protein
MPVNLDFKPGKPGLTNWNAALCSAFRFSKKETILIYVYLTLCNNFPKTQSADAKIQQLFISMLIKFSWFWVAAHVSVQGFQCGVL